MRYERILAAVAGTPWAVDPRWGQTMVDVLNRRLRDGANPAAFDDEAREVSAARDRRKAKPRPGGVALIPLYGVMTQRADIFMQVCGMLSTDQVGQLVDEAAADKSVEAIVLDVDSPGGSAFGTAELGAKIAAASKQKKVVAVANSLAASAAYWAASQAGELVVTPGGMVGSIGVYLTHVDRSEELRQMGRTVTFVASSAKKVAGSETGPLDAVGRAEFEGIVAGYYDAFVKAVAKGRNATQTRVRDEFGGGGMLLADAAVKVGMADRVATLDEVLARYGVSTADLAPSAESDRGGVEIRRRRLQLDCATGGRRES